MTNIGTLIYILGFLSISSVISPANGRASYPHNANFASFDTSQEGLFDSTRNVPVPLPLKRVVIDAGHGGHDHGCSGSHSTEKHVTLAIALELEKELLRRFPDMEIRQTRKTDVFVPLHERIALANRDRADVFISIHANSFSDTEVSGTEVFVMGLHTAAENLRVAQRENASVLLENDFLQNYDGYDPASPEGHIILSMYQNLYLDNSISLARMISDSISAETGFVNRGVKQAGFVILRKAAMPSVLIETGFLTHQGDEAVLATQAGHKSIASAIAGALSSYREELNADLVQAVRLREKTRQVVQERTDGTRVFPVTYRVQLAAISGNAPTSLPDFIAGKPIDILYEDGFKKLLAGRFERVEEAWKFRDEVRQKSSYSGAFVTAYRGDVRIDLNKAVQQNKEGS